MGTRFFLTKRPDAAAAAQHNEHRSGPPSTRATITMKRLAAAAVQHNARTRSGPPSTRASIAMDGGVADTARANTTVLTQAINRQSFGEEKASVSDALPCTIPCTPSCSYDRVRRNIRCFKLLVTLSGFGPRSQGSFQQRKLQVFSSPSSGSACVSSHRSFACEFEIALNVL